MNSNIKDLLRDEKTSKFGNDFSKKRRINGQPEIINMFIVKNTVKHINQ